MKVQLMQFKEAKGSRDLELKNHSDLISVRLQTDLPRVTRCLMTRSLIAKQVRV
jgi:hypothetical protein